MTSAVSPQSIPQVPRWFQDGFHSFLTPFLKRHFHAIAIARQSRFDSRVAGDRPVIVFGNHPSWWDPLIAHFLNRQLLPERQFYAPIDADALERYRVFSKLGFFGVKLESNRGAAAFLKQTAAILSRADTALWLTPEGRFCDIRDHSAELMPGLAHLCKRIDDGWAVPLALEYVFWEERLPVCLAMTGTPLRIAECPNWDKAEWGRQLTSQLRQTQSTLATLSMQRSSEPFDNLLSGRTGAGTIYDLFRRTKALLTGQRFRSQHGDHFE